MEEQAGNNGTLCDKLLEIVQKTRLADIEIKCDVCKSNPVVVLCTNCILCLCKVCYEQHSEENSQHTIVPLDKVSFCSEHNKIFEYYCENCDQFACSSCKVKHSSEDNHNLGTIEEMAFKRINMLTKGDAQINKTNKALLKTEASFTSTQRSLEKHHSKVKKSIDNQYEAQCKRLKERHDQMERELNDAVSQKSKLLETHLKEIESIKNEASKVKKLLEDQKKTPDQKVFSTKKKQTMESYVQQIDDRFEYLTSKPVGPANIIKFNPVPDTSEVLGQLCVDVEIQNLPKRVFEDETIEFLILVKNEQNQYCNEGGCQVSVELRSSTSEVTTGTVKDYKDGSYKVQVKAEQIGEAMLSASIDGLQIKGSPFTVEVSPGQDTPHKTVNCDGKMGRPWGIAFGKNDIWAVTDDTNHCVYLFNNQNQLVCRFGEQGREEGKFNRPFGVAFDSNGYLYVVDGGNNRVQMFNTNGEFQDSFGKKGSGDGELQGPFGIAIHSNKAYIADFHNKRISVFKIEGSFCLSFGSDHLAGPQDVTVSTNDQVLVADYCSHKIYIFTLNGDFVNEFGKKGHAEGDLFFPLSITTTWNTQLQILISDENHCVSIFHENGEFVGCLGCSYGCTEGKLNFPNGIAIKANDVYVADWTNQRVQIFNLSKVLFSHN